MSSVLPLRPSPPNPHALVARVRHHVRYTLVKEWEHATRADLWHAFSLAAREQLVDPLLETERRYAAARREARGVPVDRVPARPRPRQRAREHGLPRALARRARRARAHARRRRGAGARAGGRQRRASAGWPPASSTRSRRTRYPAYGYGINYEFGLFKQVIEGGWQRERPDHWMADHYPWLIERADDACIVPLYGRIEHEHDAQRRLQPALGGHADPDRRAVGSARRRLRDADA